MTTMDTATTAAAAKRNWISWFKEKPSTLVINKTHQEKLFKTFDATVANESIAEAIMQHEETAFLHKINFGTNKVSVFHHLISTGGTIYDEGTKEYGFIQGLGNTARNFMTPDMETLEAVTSDTAVAVPTINQVLGVKSEEDVDNLDTSATVTYRPRNFTPIPPFLLEPVMQGIMESKGDARKVLVKCAEAIKTFDTEHNGDDTYTEKAKQKSKDIVNWLYLISKDSEAVAAVATMGCENEILCQRLNEKTKNALEVKTVDNAAIAIDVEASLKRPFEILAATSSSTSEFMEKLTQLQSQNQEKTTKTFKKIPAKYQQMILVASSVGEITEIEYNADAVEFFKCSNTLNAQVMLNSLMESEDIECSVSSAVATTFMYGSFLWRNQLSPAGLASSVLSSEGIMRTDTLHEGMVLDFATKFDMSAASLSKLTKTQVLFPTDIEEMTHRFRGLQALASFFFKSKGYMSQGVKQIVNFCLDNKMMLKARLHLDPSFIAKMMCSVDERIYQWLRQCSVHDMVIDTDVNLMDFRQLLMDIRLNRFVYFLPPSIAKLAHDDKIEPKRGDSARKEKATTVKNPATTVKNPALVPEWKMRNNESWNTVFRNKTIQGPMLTMNCHPCLKYHVRGSCFNDCRNIASHCTLSGDDKGRVTKFIKSLRGE